MDNIGKKAAIAAYKERKSIAGIYLVRCTADGRVWVGETGDVSAIQNRVWFGLRMGSSPNKDLQAAWNASGADAIQFEILEKLDDEDIAFVRQARLSERVSYWRKALNAKAV
jgi:hypothetical protein